MTRGRVGRREFLGTLVALGAASAGCLSTDTDSGSRYTDWVPAAEDGLAFAYLEYSVTEDTGDDAGLVPFLLPAGTGGGEQPVELPDDALGDRESTLLSVISGVGGRILLGATLAFSRSGLGALVERGRSETVDEMFIAEGIIMGTGKFETDTLDRRLRSDDGPGFVSAYELVDETDRFRFYERSGDTGTSAPATAAISEDRVLFGPDRDGIERVFETTQGERPRAADALDGFEWLAETVGDGNLVAGWHGPVNLDEMLGESGGQPARDLFVPEDDVFVAMTLNPEADELTMDLAVHSDSLPADRRETFESTFGAGDRETSTPSDGRFSVSGALDVPFQPVGEDWTDDLPSGDDLPAEIREAVPEDAVEITEAPNEERAGVYRVELADELGVDELTIRAIESEWETTIDMPTGINWLNAQVNPDGDEIRVVVTVDGVSGIIATKEIP